MRRNSRHAFLILALVGTAGGCLGPSGPQVPDLTGHWLAQPNFLSPCVETLQLLASRGGLFSGNRVLVCTAVSGFGGTYAVSGSHDHPSVTMLFASSGFTPGTTYTGVLIHRDTIVGRMEGWPPEDTLLFVRQ